MDGVKPVRHGKTTIYASAWCKPYGASLPLSHTFVGGSSYHQVDCMRESWLLILLRLRRDEMVLVIAMATITSNLRLQWHPLTIIEIIQFLIYQNQLGKGFVPGTHWVLILPNTFHIHAIMFQVYLRADATPSEETDGLRWLRYSIAIFRVFLSQFLSYTHPLSRWNCRKRLHGHIWCDPY